MTENGNRTIFITGAGAGIGAATVRLLAQRGHTVFAGVRKPGEAVDGPPGVHHVQLDVTDPDSVAEAAAFVRDKVGNHGLDALINNAGIIVQGPLELISPDDLRRQFDVNTLGPARVIREFLPMLRAGRGRVVNISAPTARLPIPFMGPIGASKAALASLSDALRVELAPWDVPVVLVEPGATATDIFDKAESVSQASLDNTDPVLVTLYREQLAAMTTASAKQKLGPVDKVAAVIVRAVEARKPKRRYPAGAGVRTFGALSHLPGRMRDGAISSALGLAKANKRARAAA
jgi:NAD(P)-dependent dehydrogenase (short-subunit alcohol dehydrogenase family)